jgi:hypothetical protein
MNESNTNEVSVVLYLYKRLHELGVRGVHGLPVCTLEEVFVV